MFIPTKVIRTIVDYRATSSIAKTLKPLIVHHERPLKEHSMLFMSVSNEALDIGDKNVLISVVPIKVVLAKDIILKIESYIQENYIQHYYNKKVLDL